MKAPKKQENCNYYHAFLSRAPALGPLTKVLLWGFSARTPWHMMRPRSGKIYLGLWLTQRGWVWVAAASPQVHRDTQSLQQGNLVPCWWRTPG